MKVKRKISILVNSMLLAIVIPLIGIKQSSSVHAQSDAKYSSNKILEASSNNIRESYFANYDVEQILGPAPEVKKPKVFGDQNVEKYPSIYYPQTFPDLTDDIEDSEEVLNATSLGIIRQENVRVLAETDENIKNGTLGKHISADGQFYGKIDDETERIIKKISIKYMMTSRHSLGVFAPAGEIITINIDEKILNQTYDKSRLKVIIGYPYQENTVHAIKKLYFTRLKSAQNRMPILYKEFEITSTTFKVGSPFGGMMFLEIPSSIKQNFDVTISGGVDNPSYQLGVSTKEDWKKVLEAPSPYLWLQTPYLNFLMPKTFINNVKDPDNALTFWYKAVTISNYAMGLDTLTTNKIRPVNMIFDSYIPNGGALAYPASFMAICPSSWSTDTLNYESIMSSTSVWGTIHELNHNFQYPLSAGFDKPWTVGDNFMEITNNVINVLAFVSYTDIAMSRVDDKDSFTGWQRTVDPYYNLLNLKEGKEKVTTFEALGGDKVYAYIDLIHSFGVDKFIHFLRQIGGGESSEFLNQNQTIASGSNYLRTEDGFALAASKYFEKDMTDYFANLWNFHLKEETVEAIHNLGYEKYFTIQNVYAMGEKGVETGRPYVMDRNDSFTLNLDEKTISSAESFTIDSITNVTNGSCQKNSNGTYTFTPNENFDDMTFEINYKVKLQDDETTYTKTLKSQFSFKINQSVHATEYSITSTYYDVKTALSEFVKEENITKKYVAKSLTTNVTNGLNLTYFKTKVVFDFTGEITFMVYGDDKTYLKIGEKEAICNTYIDDIYGYNTAVTMKENKIVMQVEKNKPIYLEAACYNGGGPGNIRVKYRSAEKEDYFNIASTDCLNSDVSDDVINDFLIERQNTKVYDTKYDLQTNALNRFYQSGVELNDKLKSVKCVNRNGEEIPGNNYDHLIKNMTDKNTETWFTPNPNYGYPLYYVFDFGETTMISNSNVQFYDTNMYLPKSYKYYVGMENGENIEYKEIFSRTTVTTQSTYSDQFGLINGRYLILEITEPSNSNTSSIVEISFYQSIKSDENINYYSSLESQFTYSTGWNEVKGNYINDIGKYTEDGTITFLVDGTDLLLYFYGEETNESYVLVDGIEYSITANYENGKPSVFIAGLEDKVHIVKIVAKNLVFDAAKTTGTILEQENLDKVNLSIKDYTYDGNTHLPEISLNGKTLVKDVDYMLISIDENINVGTVEFVIEGIGLYKGQTILHFDINARTLTSDDVVIEVENQEYNGSKLTPNITVTLEGTLLEQGKDYEITYDNNLNAGNALITITFKGNYQGIVSNNFVINAKDLSDSEIELKIEDQKYTGKAINPEIDEIEVEINGQIVTLKCGVDYDVSFRDNTNVGKGKVIITFKGNYSGISTIEFNILKNSNNIGLIIVVAVLIICSSCLVVVPLIIKKKRANK